MMTAVAAAPPASTDVLSVTWDVGATAK